jgi:hypothetical protein
MGRPVAEGESPVSDTLCSALMMTPSRAGHEESRLNLGGPPPKTKYTWRPIVQKYREGKVKSTAGAE